MVILSTFCSRDGAPGDLCAETKVCAIPGDTENAFSRPLPLNCLKPGGEGALSSGVDSYPAHWALETRGMAVPTHLINPSSLGEKYKKTGV